MTHQLTMPATRLQNGFHRVGLVLAGTLALPTFVIAPYAMLTGAPSSDVTIMSGLALAAAALLYAVCRALAWIAEGFVGAQPVSRAPARTAPEIRQGRDWRWRLVLVLEGLLLLTVLATAVYYLVLALDDGQTFNMRLLGGWIAFLLLALTFLAPMRRRVERRGTREAGDYAFLLEAAIISLIMATAIGIMMGLKQYGLSLPLMFPTLLFFAMFFWPDLRHRIRTGAWRH